MGRLGPELDSEFERQSGEFICELRNILISMDKGFHFVFKNGQ